jgi:hypothetical protein
LRKRIRPRAGRFAISAFVSIPRIILIRSKGEMLGTVEAADARRAEQVAARLYKLDAERRKRLIVRERPRLGARRRDWVR